MSLAGTMPFCIRRAQRGQAMVEFAIILIVFIALAVGMVHIAKLLNYQYWAQQEARYLAFEQTWVPAAYYEESGQSPEQLLQNSEDLHRPKLLDELGSQRQTEDRGGVIDLFAGLLAPIAENASTTESPIVLASAKDRSIWHRSSKDLWNSITARFTAVSYAYAGLLSDGVREPGEREVLSDEEVLLEWYGDDQFSFEPNSLEHGIHEYLLLVDFGEALCDAMLDGLRKHHWQPGQDYFRSSDCAPKLNRDFAIHLAEKADVKELVRHISVQVDSGIMPREAVENGIQLEVAHQFFSFFDDMVRDARIAAVPYIIQQRIERTLGEDSGKVAHIIADLRYIGSSVALTIVSYGQLAEVLAVLPMSRKVSLEKFVQNIVFGILHADAPEPSYFLNPQYLPVPLAFGGASAAFQNAAMENALRGGENFIGDFLGDADGDESDLIDPLIHESNKETFVQYQADEGMTRNERKHFAEDVTLTARFFLITQPWHITRKVSPLGSYREIGTETDSIGQDTEEALLRRRVAGLWLFPSAPTAFFREPFQFLGLDGLDAAFDVVSGFDSVIANIKSTLIDNPLFKLFDTLSQIPFLGNLVPRIPKFPVVRPAAYPGSTELRNQDHSPDDRLSGSTRNFSDYVKEQRDHNPQPKPGFDNDTFD